MDPPDGMRTVVDIFPIFLCSWQDNGAGMPHKDIPNMLGRVLSGTKYGVKQTRGKFGLGAKMALIWSKMTTGLPFEIYAARYERKGGTGSKSHYVLDIDIHRCRAEVWGKVAWI